MQSDDILRSYSTVGVGDRGALRWVGKSETHCGTRDAAFLALPTNFTVSSLTLAALSDLIRIESTVARAISSVPENNRRDSDENWSQEQAQ